MFKTVTVQFLVLFYSSKAEILKKIIVKNIKLKYGSSNRKGIVDSKGKLCSVEKETTKIRTCCGITDDTLLWGMDLFWRLKIAWSAARKKTLQEVQIISLTL